jgi:hypothetical protein
MRTLPPRGRRAAVARIGALLALLLLVFVAAAAAEEHDASSPAQRRTPQLPSPLLLSEPQRHTDAHAVALGSPVTRTPRRMLLAGDAEAAAPAPASPAADDIVEALARHNENGENGTSASSSSSSSSDGAQPDGAAESASEGSGNTLKLVLAVGFAAGLFAFMFVMLVPNYWCPCPTFVPFWLFA